MSFLKDASTRRVLSCHRTFNLNLFEGGVVTVRTIPLFLSIVIGVVFALLGYGFVRSRGHRNAGDLTATGDQVLIGLALLATFVLGAFLSYALFAWAQP